MSKEQAQKILSKIQNGTASEEEKKQAKLAFAVISANILVKPSV